MQNFLNEKISPLNCLRYGICNIFTNSIIFFERKELGLEVLRSPPLLQLKASLAVTQKISVS